MTLRIAYAQARKFARRPEAIVAALVSLGNDDAAAAADVVPVERVQQAPLTQVQITRMGYNRLLATERKVRHLFHISATPQQWQSERIALLFCSGPCGSDDVAAAIESYAQLTDYYFHTN